MKSISAEQQSAAGAAHVVSAWLIQLDTTPVVRMTTAGIDIVYAGDTYLGSGLALAVSPVTETTAIEATALTIQLSGVPTSLLSLALQSQTQGKTCTVMVAWFDPSTGQMIGSPSTEARGTVDIPTINQSGETATVSLSVETAMSDFSRPNVRRFTDADHQARHPGDLFFQYVVKFKEAALIFPSREAQ